MTLINLQEDLLNFNFKKKGSIDIVGNKEHPVFTIDDSEKLEGNVYMWVTEVEGIPNEVLYIRKAGKKLIKRCKEHTQGFRRGNKNGINLLKLLNSILVTTFKNDDYFLTFFYTYLQE